MRLHRTRPVNPSQLVLMTLAVAASAASAAAQTNRTVTKLSDGVYEIQHRNARDGFAGGNTTVVIGERQVLVVDTPFLPSEAREDIAQIRQWTEKPVTFLVTTHFHNDHNLGNRVYMDAFPSVTIIAHTETKHEMDLFGPGSAERETRSTPTYERMLETGKTNNGTVLTDADKVEIRNMLARRKSVVDEIERTPFQSATLTFDHDFAIDLGGRAVQVKFLGRGNTSGDAVVFLPKERIVVAGDLVVHPIPYFYDGYPSEWALTLQRLVQLDATTIVPGHGPVMHDSKYVLLVRDLLASAVAQMDSTLRKAGPAMFRSIADVKGGVDLSSFRQKFAGSDNDLGAAFDATSADLVKLVLREASLR